VYEKPDLSIDTNNFDPFFEEAAYAIVTTQVGSTSMIQRRFSIGYNRARRLMDQLEMAGIIGPAEGSKPREVLIQDKNTLQMMLNFRRGLINKDFIIENKHAIKERVLFYQEQKAKEEEWARRELIDAEKERIKMNIKETESNNITSVNPVNDRILKITGEFMKENQNNFKLKDRSEVFLNRKKDLKIDAFTHILTPNFFNYLII